MTGAISPAARSTGADAKLPPDGDLAYAKIAVSEVLGRGGKDASQAWENPQTRAYGTVTPLAAVYRQEGSLCRDFIASHVTEDTESWMQGEACRIPKGRWEVRSMKPWRRS